MQLFILVTASIIYHCECYLTHFSFFCFLYTCIFFIIFDCVSDKQGAAAVKSDPLMFLE